MKKKFHAVAGAVGFLTILTFWTSTVVSELFGTHEMIAIVKAAILKGMIVLISAMAFAGASGMSLGVTRQDVRALANKKRMPIIAANGLLLLVPSAFFLEYKASAGAFDTWFYTVQLLELIAGATNLAMMGLNIRDGLSMTGRIGAARLQRGARNQGGSIEERDGGPLVAKGVARLTGPDGKRLPIQPAMALCRCVSSKNKPFCDGSHRGIGWRAEGT